MTAKLTIAKFLLNSIKNAGIHKIFGIPGDMVIRFFKVIEDDPEIKLYTFSHEPGVGFAAIASARATRKPAVACITYGVGGLNMLNSVACAYAEKTPLIVISGGQGEEEKANDVFLHHSVKNYESQLNVFKEVTCEACILDSPKTAYSKIKKTIAACQEFMLPVYIEIPRDMVDKEIVIPQNEDKWQYPVHREAIEEAADEIISRISTAKKPVIIVGVEADRFELNEKIISLSRKTGLPIVSDFLARDIIPKDEPNYFGIYLGEAGNSTAKDLVDQADFLLMLGVIITDTNLGIKLKRLKRENMILCVSRKVLAGHHIYENVPLHPLTEELLNREIKKKILSYPAKPKLTFNKACKYTEDTVTVNEIVDAVNWFFNEFGKMPIISDTGDCLFASTKIDTTSVMASPYYATMGFGTPAAIGYAITTGNRPLVLLGDGGFQMTGQEICHCPRFGINPIFIIFNNKRAGECNSFSIQVQDLMNLLIGHTQKWLNSGEAKATSVIPVKNFTERLKIQKRTRHSPLSRHQWGKMNFLKSFYLG